MFNFLRKWLLLAIPLPPVEKRVASIVPILWFNSNISLEKDLDYLLYRLVVAMAGVGAIVLFILLLDVIAETNFLIDSVSFYKNKTLFSVAFKNAMVVPYCSLMLLFYLRIKSTVNIREVRLPFGKKKSYVDWFNSWSRKRWIWQSVFMIVVGTVVTAFGSHIYVVQLAFRYEMQDSFPFIFLLVITQYVGISFMPVAAVIYAISLEKSLYFFSEFKFQLEQLSEETLQGLRNDRTDSARD